MTSFFGVDTIFFTVLGYPLSYIECVGTLLYLWSVWLIARRRMLTWPVGIVSVLLYMLLFYQIRLYSDAIEQVYYLGASVYGWLYWSRAKGDAESPVAVSFSSRRAILVWAGITVCMSCAVAAAMERIHLWLPGIFPEPASYPFLDALTTVMSLVAMWLMARKHTESWVYWILVDVIGVGLYYAKDVKFISLLYVMLLVLATKGLLGWIEAEPEDRSGADRSAEDIDVAGQ
jgi:nicotinamide mononucleotide transporter